VPNKQYRKTAGNATRPAVRHQRPMIHVGGFTPATA
jgi:hypothetical protein